VAIQTPGEFDVQMGDLILQVDRLCSDRPRDGALSGARRNLGVLADRMKRGNKLDARDRQTLSTAFGAIRSAVGTDDAFEDRIADLEDWIDANLKK
jgi:hypothetical protein